MVPDAPYMSVPSAGNAAHAGQQPDATPAGVGATRRLATTAARHQASISALCEEIGVPLDELAALYQCELARLSATASVTDYLPVLAAKKVRRFYRQRALALHQYDFEAALASSRDR